MNKVEQTDGWKILIHRFFVCLEIYADVSPTTVVSLYSSYCLIISLYCHK